MIVQEFYSYDGKIIVCVYGYTYTRGSGESFTVGIDMVNSPVKTVYEKQRLTPGGDVGISARVLELSPTNYYWIVTDGFGTMIDSGNLYSQESAIQAIDRYFEDTCNA